MFWHIVLYFGYRDDTVVVGHSRQTREERAGPRDQCGFRTLRYAGTEEAANAFAEATRTFLKEHRNLLRYSEREEFTARVEQITTRLSPELQALMFTSAQEAFDNSDDWSDITEYMDKYGY